MSQIVKIDIYEGNLLLYVDTRHIPETEYINQQWLTILKEEYDNDIVALMTFASGVHEIPISFTPDDYDELAIFLKEEAEYTLSQARMIISWINGNVAQPEETGWGDTYVEILEGSR